MKYEKWILPAAAVIAAVLAFVPGADSGLLGALSVPFTALGWLLRTMSLSGWLGNAAALVLYGAVCCIPLVFWWRSARRREDWLLVLLCGVLALVLYYMVNPGLRHAKLQNEVGDLVCAAAFWCTVAAWGVLKLVGWGAERLERNIYRCLRIFLLLCAASCVMECFGTELANLIESFTWNMENYYGYGSGAAKLPTYIFLILDYLALASEDGLCALVLYKGVRLLEELEQDPFSEACVAAAGEVSYWCRQTLVIVTLAGLALNLGQLMMAPVLLNVYMSIRFPVTGIAVSFAMLAVTKLLVRGKALKDDNDLII